MGYEIVESNRKQGNEREKSNSRFGARGEHSRQSHASPSPVPSAWSSWSLAVSDLLLVALS